MSRDPVISVLNRATLRFALALGLAVPAVLGCSSLSSPSAASESSPTQVGATARGDGAAPAAAPALTAAPAAAPALAAAPASPPPTLAPAGPGDGVANPQSAGAAGTAASCKRFLCPTGEHCALSGGRAACVADSQSVCPSIRCAEDRPHCVEWAATGEHACLRRDECHRDSECGGKRCQPEATCVRAPCFQTLICG